MKKETMDRIQQDAPLIYFATAGGILAQIMLSKENGVTWEDIATVLGVSGISIFLIYAIILVFYNLNKE